MTVATTDLLAPAFTAPAAAATAAALPGPAWLAERRQGALAALAGAAMPGADEDAWIYSRIGELDLADFAPAVPAGAALGAAAGTPAALAAADAPGGQAAAAELLDAIGARAGLVRTVGGRVVAAELMPEVAALGVVLGGADVLAGTPAGLGDVVVPRADLFTTLSDAFCGDVVVVQVPAGVRVEQPIVVVHAVAGAPGSAVFPRTFVALGEHAVASVVECFLSGGGAGGGASHDGASRTLVVPVGEIELATGAQLAYSTVQELGPNAWEIAYQASRIGRDAVLRSFVASLGGEYARQLTQAALVGENGTSELLAVYLGDGSQVQDLRSFQEHVAPRTKSELVFKGAVSDTARSVYTGLIHMHPGAKRADASQTNRNLVLSEGAHADSVPNLDIEENDVRCSHASAVGPIDADQLFYLATRGVPPETAERLVLLGFFDDLLERAPEPGLAAYLRAVVARRLAAGLDAPPAR